MPYVERDGSNSIIGVNAIPQYDGQEHLPIDNSDVVAFLNPLPPTNEEIYEQTMENQALLKAVVLALNDGSFVPGAALSNAALKTVIKSKM